MNARSLMPGLLPRRHQMSPEPIDRQTVCRSEDFNKRELRNINGVERSVRALKFTDHCRRDYDLSVQRLQNVKQPDPCQSPDR